jgi:alkylation response protein AidB-like acyl-CoA dehydrogenase
MTEPGAGSDAFSLTTRATRVEGGYVLNGKKMLITFGPIADFAIVFATVNPARQNWGITAFFVDRGTPGFTAGSVDEKMGLRTVPMGSLTFEDCFVPEANRLGAEGAGASIFGSSQEFERGCILANQIGLMERQLEACVDYARTRKAFGQPIGKFQAVSNRLAEMKLRLETARLLHYRAAWKLMHNQAAMLDAAIANLYTGEAVVESSMDAIRIHGGRGYLSEYGVERDLRDAVAAPIYGGTADIQRTIIARLLGV